MFIILLFAYTLIGHCIYVVVLKENDSYDSLAWFAWSVFWPVLTLSFGLIITMHDLADFAKKLFSKK